MSEEQTYTGPTRPPGWPGYNSYRLNLVAVALWNDERLPGADTSLMRDVMLGMMRDGELPEAIPDETWEDYINREMLRRVSFLPRWVWIFGRDWTSVDNTAKGAAQRIFQLVSEGLPLNWAEQIQGKEPLSYTELVPAMVVPESEEQFTDGAFKFGRVSVHDKMKAAQEKT